MKMADPALLLLELFDDSASLVVVCEEISTERVFEYFQNTIPLYFLDEFKMAKKKLSCLFARPCQQEEYHLGTDLGELRAHLQNNS